MSAERFHVVEVHASDGGAEKTGAELGVMVEDVMVLLIRVQ
jgi:hypothetical protein